MRIHAKIAVVGAILLVTAVAAWFDHTAIPAANESSTYTAITPQPAPDVTFTLLDGTPLALRSLAGKTVWLHFWASWCVPCKIEFPRLLEQMEQHPNRILLAVSADEKMEDVQRFLVPFRRTFAPLFADNRVVVAIDPKREIITGVFQTFQYPETFIIDPDLTIRQKIIGVVP